MKKFITAISLQGKDLEEVIYKAAEGTNLQYDTPNSFPILSSIKNSVKAGERIKVVPIIINNKLHADVSNKNFEIFVNQLNRLADEAKFTYEMCPQVEKEEDDNYDTLVNVFSKLIESVDDNDELYACITFGTKPLSMLTVLSLNYAYKVKKNVSVKNIVYGAVRWDKSKPIQDGEIYDVSPLFYIDTSLEYLANLKLERPETVLRTILGIDEEK